MSKVITFSRLFPSYHPKAGQPTYFVEKIWKSLFEMGSLDLRDVLIPYEAAFPSKYIEEENIHHHNPKHHTIRAGHRFKAGDWFSPRVWGNDVNPKSGKKGPYHSKQIIIAPDIQVKKVCDFEIKSAYKELPLDYDSDIIIDHRTYNIDTAPLNELSKNDGLITNDLLDWFKWPKPTGEMQIICWSDHVKY